MTKEQVKTFVGLVLVNQLRVKHEDVTDDATIIDDLGADSLDSMEIVMALEEGLNIEIPDEDMFESDGQPKKFTVGQVVDYVAGKAGAA